MNEHHNHFKSNSVPSGADRIGRERQRQIFSEGYTPQSDDAWTEGELAEAAACYAISATDIANHPGEDRRHVPASWPWDIESWKPTSRIEMLVKAGALIAAEIDRLQRTAPRS